MLSLIQACGRCTSHRKLLQRSILFHFSALLLTQQLFFYSRSVTFMDTSAFPYSCSVDFELSNLAYHYNPIYTTFFPPLSNSYIYVIITVSYTATPHNHRLDRQLCLQLLSTRPSLRPSTLPCPCTSYQPSSLSPLMRPSLGPTIKSSIAPTSLSYCPSLRISTKFQVVVINHHRCILRGDPPSHRLGR